MKTKFCFLILLLLSALNAFSQSGIFNYYKREVDYKEAVFENNLSVSDKVIIEVSEENGKVVVTGNYFDSSCKKFQDIYENGNLISTHYFLKSGEDVFQRLYFYDADRKLSCIKTSVKETNGFIYSSNDYFNYENNSIVDNFIVSYRLKQKSYNSLGTVYLNDDFKPVKSECKMIGCSDQQAVVSDVVEHWIYNKAGCSYRCDVDNKKQCLYQNIKNRITTEFFENGNRVYRESESIDEDLILSEYAFHEHISRKKGRCICYDSLYKEFDYDNLKYIHLQDEAIILQEDRIISDKLSIPLSIFGFRYYVNNFSPQES